MEGVKIICDMGSVGGECPENRTKDSSILGFSGKNKDLLVDFSSNFLLIAPIVFLCFLLFYIWDENRLQKIKNIKKPPINFLNLFLFSLLVVFFWKLFETYYLIGFRYSSLDFVFSEEIYTILILFLSVLSAYYVFVLLSYIKDNKIFNIVVYLLLSAFLIIFYIYFDFFSWFLF